MARRDIEGSRALVTGASSGIGRALVIELARVGARVVATARREDRLFDLVEEAAAEGARLETVVGDITDAVIRQRALDRAVSAFGGLDILVNNAGVGAMGRFEKADPIRLRRVMEVNLFALAEMTRTAIPVLRQGRKPIVVNVSSILGHRGTPHNSEYCASKFAVQGFSEALRAELSSPPPIDVLVVSPGTTETEFFESVLERTSAPKWPEHKAVPAEVVARKTVRAIRRGSHEIVPYTYGKILLWLNRLSPRLVDALMTRYV